MQNKLCKNIIAAEDFDCTNLHETFKKLLADKIQEKHELLEASIQAAPHKLEKDIQNMIKGSETDILNKKQQQQKLNRIWID
ncbi:MAG TPA: hypothetical protein VJJ26_00305, partial [Candidatus Babeliales bacterium]|nr:hypothetical protein [Candidatus Babeliales bacterium]